MNKRMTIIYITMLICGLFACGKPAGKENTDTETTTENTEDMAKTAAAEEDTEEGTSATEGTGKETTEQEEKEFDADTVDNKKSSEADKKTSAASVDSEDGSTADKEPKDDSDNSYFGTWKVTAYYMPGVSAMSAEDAEGYMGKICEYLADVFDGDGEVTQAPDYQEFTETEADFSANYRGATFESVGIAGDLVKQVNVSNSYAFGCSFYVKDASTILICQDGVFFEAVKQ